MISQVPQTPLPLGVSGQQKNQVHEFESAMSIYFQVYLMQHREPQAMLHR